MLSEVAIADHRGTQPTAEELRRLAAETQLGGILAGAGGTVLVHVGDGPAKLELLRRATEGSDLSSSVFYPTHVNRSRALLDEAAAWAEAGGFVDITVSTTQELIAAGDIPAADALRHLLEAGAPPDHITLSSDAGGSLPVYCDGELRGLTVAQPDCLLALLGELFNEDRELFAVALAAVTRNPARALRLDGAAGRIEECGRADLLVVDMAAAELRGLVCAGIWRDLN